MHHAFANKKIREPPKEEKMFATIKKTLVAGAVLAATAVSAQAVTAKLDQPNMGFGSGPIVVKSTDGKKWSKIESSDLTLPYAVFIGYNENDIDYDYHHLYQDGTKITPGIIVPLNGWANPLIANYTAHGSTDNFNSITRTLLLEACNSRLNKPGAIHEDQHMFFKVPLQLLTRFERDNGTWFLKDDRGHSMVPVVCKAFPKRVPPKPPQISKVRFQAYAENKHSCPRQRVVRLRLEADKVGTADVIVMRDDGKKIEETVPVTKPGEHQFFVLESTRVKKSETRKYYLMVKGTKISVGWKTVEIKCHKPPKPATNDLQVDTRPDPAAPQPQAQPRPRPTVVVNPVRPQRPNVLKPTRLACIGGKVKLNTCYCKPNYKKIKIGKHAYRCARLVTDKVNKRKPTRQNKWATPVRQNKRTAPARRKQQQQQQNGAFLNLLKKKKKR